MDKETTGAADRLLELSVKLSKYIEEFREKTVLIQTLLADEDEESIFKIEDVLNHRDALIKSYNQTALEFKQVQNLYTMDSLIPEETQQKLNSLEQERQSIVDSLRKVEYRSMKRMSELYSHNRGQIKQIEEGKRLMNAYQAGPQVTDGIFFDGRK